MSPSDPPPRRFIERRKDRRLIPPPGSLLSFTAIHLPLSFAGEQEGDGTILNLSSSGCKILSEGTVTVGQDYHLIIQLPSSPIPLTIESAIVRWIGEQTFGFKFEAIRQDQEEQLRELLHRLRSTAS